MQGDSNPISGTLTPDAQGGTEGSNPSARWSALLGQCNCNGIQTQFQGHKGKTETTECDREQNLPGQEEGAGRVAVGSLVGDTDVESEVQVLLLRHNESNLSSPHFDSLL